MIPKRPEIRKATPGALDGVPNKALGSGLIPRSKARAALAEAEQSAERPTSPGSEGLEALAQKLADEMLDRLLDADYAGALDLAQRVLDVVPHHEHALQVMSRCRRELDLPPITLAQFGMQARDVLEIKVRPEELKKVSLDPQTMYVVSMLDGRTDLRTVFEVTGVPGEGVVEKLVVLFRRGVIGKID